MPSLNRETPRTRADHAVDAQRRLDAAVLWSAIRADRRAQDERTAKLRAMLLAVGEDGAA
jgi:hypothetical protein